MSLNAYSYQMHTWTWSRSQGKESAVFLLFNGEPGESAVVQCIQVTIEWLDKSGEVRANLTVVTKLEGLAQIPQLVDQIEIGTNTIMKDLKFSQILKTEYQLLSQQQSYPC